MADMMLVKTLVACWLVIATVSAKSMDRLYQMDKFVMYTDAVLGDNTQHVISVEGKKATIFKVRACENAHLNLAAIYDRGSTTTQLTIGADSNTKTTLTFQGSGELIQSVDTPDILHCSELRAFWVSWAYGYFRFGVGASLGTGMVLEVAKTGDLNHDVSSIGIFTADGISGIWEMEEGQFFNLVATPPQLTQEPYQAMTWRTVQFVSGQTYFFSVQACQDVNIYLGEVFGSAEYTIELGRGGFNRIYRGAEQLYSDTESYLTCDKPQTFWITWWNDHIILGSGFIRNSYELMSVNSTGIDILNSIGFAAGPESQATFDFVADIDEYYTFEIKDGSDINDYQHWYHVAEASFLTFSVRACQDVQVIFSDQLGSVSNNAVVLQLNWGGENSGCRLIKQTGELISEIDTPLLQCDVMTSLWATFSSNEFRIGQFSTKGQEKLFGGTTELDGRMTGVGFASSAASSWAIATIEPGLLQLTTNGPYTEDNHDTWATGNRRFFKEFRLNLCTGSARISVTPCLGCWRMGRTGSYHVIIEENKVRIINQQYLGNSTEIDSEEVTGLTKCGSFMSFFITWYNDVLTFGQGDRTSGDIVMAMGEPLPYDVTDIAIASDSKCIWEWDMETGEQLSFQQKAQNLGHNWVKISPILNWQRFWLTGSGAEFVLAVNYGDSSQAYTFTFNSNSITLAKNGQQVSSYSGLSLNKLQRRLMVATWENGVITLGPETGGDTYISYTDDSPLTIGALGTLPYGESSEIRMPHTFASEMAFTTLQDGSSPQNWMELNHHDSLIFNIKGGSNSIRIILAPFMNLGGLETFYRLVIGGSSNQRTSVMEGTGDVLADVASPDILSVTEKRTFWIKWDHGEIVFGKGNIVGRDIVIAYYDPSPNPINAVAFRGNGENVEWEVGLVPYGSLAGLSPEEGGGNPGSGGGLSGGAVAGIVIGVLLLVAIIAGGGYMYQSGRVQAFANSRNASTLARGANAPKQFQNETRPNDVQPSSEYAA